MDYSNCENGNQHIDEGFYASQEPGLLWEYRPQRESACVSHCNLHIEVQRRVAGGRASHAGVLPGRGCGVRALPDPADSPVRLDSLNLHAHSPSCINGLCGLEESLLNGRDLPADLGSCA